MLSTYVFTIAIIMAAVLILVQQWRTYVLSSKSWNELIAELHPTPTGEITAIALQFLNPGQSAIKSNGNRGVRSLGGIKGLVRMYSNGGLLIALAAQAELSNPEETRRFVSKMRRDGAELRRMAFWLSLHLLDARSERNWVRIQRAAAAYYRMIYRLLEVARDYSPNDLPALSRALWS